MTLSTQFYTLLAMIGMGSCFGIALDTYNRFLKRGKRKRWIVFINDLLFWIAQTLLIFYVLFIVNHGELRFYLFLAILCGFAAYQSLMKSMYNRLLESVIQFVIHLWRLLVKAFTHMIFQPIKSIIIFLVSVVVFVGKGLLTLVKRIGSLLLWILKIVVTPLKWMIVSLWGLLPKKATKTVEKIYGKGAGFLKKSKNTILHYMKKVKEKRKK
ncbi:spore cortex biosynthesis protein YabQ [Bacillus litorisediminis]|uniref:spore cortex biosynthesis protein YabQ n=1 Tax=Bacillus litorisediminis TaxID=2922713 RepID=UPI001FAD2050|nr:spore cortex biosynthesis protein YabQ [Bacillus litorisediminis]